jgi:hypothetical protein
MNLKKNYRSIDSMDIKYGLISVMGIKEVIEEFESKMEYYMKSESLKKLKAIFWKNKNRNFFKNDAINIAVHIRRPNEMDNRTDGTVISLDYYFDVIDRIKKKNSKKKVFHIYSQSTIEEFKNRNTENFVFHLNESLFETFIGMVAADILVTSKSSLSYTAALLNDGTIYYLPFWHCPAADWIDILKPRPYTFLANGELWLF